jgi:hypothetical protein
MFAPFMLSQCVPEVVSLYVMIARKIVLSFVDQISDDQYADGEQLTPFHFVFIFLPTFTGPEVR